MMGDVPCLVCSLLRQKIDERNSLASKKGFDSKRRIEYIKCALVRT